jgi:hypothetical protein
MRKDALTPRFFPSHLQPAPPNRNEKKKLAKMKEKGGIRTYCE